MSDGQAAWLLATDSITAASAMKEAFAGLGHGTEVAAPRDVVSALQAEHVGVVIDAAWSEAVATVERLAEEMPSMPLLVMGLEQHKDRALAAVRAGAADHVLLPPSPTLLRLAIDKATRSSAAHVESPPRSRMAADAGIVGSSVVMKKLASKLKRAARGSSTVLIQGESGTGKELVARQVHLTSPRRDHPFVKVHCGALPDNLLESELFGYEKGAFTGANARKPGRVELAEGGTLFLDEIGEISPLVQVKLLRVLQDRAYERLGGTETLHADVRFVAATHRDLQTMVKEGTFRQDLFYRLNVVRLVAPPLRTRPDDIPDLVALFVRDSAETNQLPAPNISPEAVRRLQTYAWPGNVRQLQHIVERLVVMTDSPELTEEDIAAELSSEASPEGTLRGVTVASGASLQGEPELSVQELALAVRIAERRALQKALKKAGTNRNLAARLLGISRRKLFYMLKDHELN